MSTLWDRYVAWFYPTPINVTKRTWKHDVIPTVSLSSEVKEKVKNWIESWVIISCNDCEASRVYQDPESDGMWFEKNIDCRIINEQVAILLNSAELSDFGISKDCPYT